MEPPLFIVPKQKTMSVQKRTKAPTERQPLLRLKEHSKLQLCLARYKVRKFSSKGATMVLFWNFAVWGCFGSPVEADHVYFGSDVLHYLALILWLVVSVLSGWLADVYFGRHRVVRTGLVFVWIGQLCICVKDLLVEYWASEHSALNTALEAAVYLFLYSGTSTVLVNSVQLGIDQMPDASADEIISFINWFVLCMHAAIFTGVVLVTNTSSVYVQIGFSLLLTVAVVSDFLLSRTWITDLPGSGNPFKGVYRVLKYAWRHKFPVQRSAFTYWDDEIPSRIDFGKEKYGGPFTTEQVEDVKTILRIFTISLPATAFVCSMSLAQNVFEYTDVKNVTFHKFTNMSSEQQTILTEVVTTPSLWVVGLLLFSEFAVYPLARNWNPSMLKRIGIAMFVFLPHILIFLVINIIAFIQSASINIFWLQLSTAFLTAIRVMLLTTAVLEFICAQSPLTVKGFLIGCMWSLYGLSILLGKLISLIWMKACSNKPGSSSNACGISYYVFTLVLCVAGFFAYCLVARWYKRRSRDEPSYRHTLVEEVYERYVSYNKKPDTG